MTRLYMNDRVYDPVLGWGTYLHTMLNGNGYSEKARVRFDQHGRKTVTKSELRLTGPREYVPPPCDVEGATD